MGQPLKEPDGQTQWVVLMLLSVVHVLHPCKEYHSPVAPIEGVKKLSATQTACPCRYDLFDMASINPYQTPLSLTTSRLASSRRYYVVSSPRGWLGFVKGDAILKLLQEHCDLGDRLIAACTESSDRYHFVFEQAQCSSVERKKYSLQLVPAPSAKSLSKTTSGTLTQFMATHFPDLDAGWLPAAHLSNRQLLILVKPQELSTEFNFDEYLIAHVPPVWWRTLVGFSYLRVIGEELNKIAANRYEVITFLGEDRYLLGQQKSNSPRLSYRLEFIGNLPGILLRGYAAICEKRLEQMRNQGWELVTCDYSVMLFKKATG